MAENQTDYNNAENGQIPEEKASEVVNRDEFGEYSEEVGHVAQDQQENQGQTNNNQKIGRNSNVAHGTPVVNPGQSN